MIESRENSSPYLTRAINAVIHNEYCDLFNFNRFEQIALEMIGNISQDIALWLLPKMQGTMALNDSMVRNINLRNVLQERIKDYRIGSEKYKSIILGVPMGGAVGHIAAALHAPFLPHTFVLTLKGGSQQADVNEYYQRSIKLARMLTKKFPQLISIQHFDPVHDGWLIRSVNHLRLKLTELPISYQDFIKKYLHKHGTVIYLEGGCRWRQFLVGEHNYFQVGGWGGFSDKEFIEGNPKIYQYCIKNNFSTTSWCLENKTMIEGYESEWGSAPEFYDSIKHFCTKNGYQLIRIKYTNPHDFSKLAFSIQKSWLEKNDVIPRGTIIEMFTQYDLTSVARGGLLPLWLIFNTNDSLELLKQMKRQFPENKPVFFSPLATFSITPDMVPYNKWEDELQGFKWVNIGARKSHYPADTLTLVKWFKPLRKWADEQRVELKRFISPEDFCKTAATVTSNIK